MAHGHPLPSGISLRDAQPSDIEALARVWYDGWRDAHAAILPEPVVLARTLASFRERLPDLLPGTRVAGPAGSPLGLAVVKHDELYQLYVSASRRGSGVGRLLIDDAEARLRAAGTHTAWLACAIGNDRAARFYETRGWRRIGVVVNRLEIPSGPFDLDVWRYEKVLAGR